MKIEIKQEDLKKRLDVFLSEHLSVNRSQSSAIIEKGIVFVNGKNQKSSYKIKPDDNIKVNKDELNNFLNPDLTLKPYNYNLHIIYEDEDLLVINKPKQMLTHPTKFDREKTLCNALIYHCKNNLSDIGGLDRLGIVHRLDKNTSGLILAAKNNKTHENLAAQIKEKTAKRKYLAIALGEFKEKSGVIDKPLKHYLKDDVKMTIALEGLSAITNYKVLEEFLGAALVELELKTGRTHQIRAHLSSINHPVFGDSLYGAKSFMRNEFYNLKTTEQLLQSYFLSFIHPKTNKRMEFQLKEKDFSEDFIKVLNFLRRNNGYTN